MGICLTSRAENGPDFGINFWHWRSLVEAIRHTGVLPDETVEGLHHPFCDNGLTKEEALLVADALEKRVLPTLGEDDRLLIDCRTTREPDDGTFHKGDQAYRNYSTNRAVLLSFILYLRTCSGFEVL